MEGDRTMSSRISGIPYFYPRPHMEGDRHACLEIPNRGNFYPRPHMEGDERQQLDHRGGCISTHALTWRATWSITASGWAISHFYPRPHMEGDDDLPF